MSLILSGNSGSLTVDSTAGITFPNGSNPQAAPSKVLQVVNSTYSTATSTTSTSFVTTGLSASITPLFSTSKILVLINDCMQIGGTSDNGGGLLISRGGTNIWNSSNTGLYIYTASGSTSYNSQMVNIIYLDSPATTSSTTYTFQMQARASDTVVAQYGSTPASMILMEIAQ